MNSIWFLATLIAWIFAAESIQAQNWKQTSAPTTGDCWSLGTSADGTKLIAPYSTGLQSGGIYLSTDSGATWVAATNLPQASWTSVASSADGTRLAAGGASGLFISSDSGANWSPVTNYPLVGSHGLASSADGTTLIAISTSAGGVFISRDAGVSWTQPTVAGAANYGWLAVSCSADGTVVAMIPFLRQGIYTSTDSGNTWSGYTATSPSVNAAGVAVSADGTTIVAGNQRNLYTSTNSGVNFFTNNVPQGTTWDAAAASADGTKLLAASQSGLVFTSTNSGISWQSNSISRKTWTAAISSSDGAKLGIAGINGAGIYTWHYAPMLSLSISDTNLIVLWPDSTYTNVFNLQQTADLSIANWSEVNQQVIDDGNNKSVTIPISENNLFFRLKH